jgi:hypothetical protein
MVIGLVVSAASRMLYYSYESLGTLQQGLVEPTTKAFFHVRRDTMGARAIRISSNLFPDCPGGPVSASETLMVAQTICICLYRRQSGAAHVSLSLHESASDIMADVQCPWQRGIIGRGCCLSVTARLLGSWTLGISSWTLGPRSHHRWPSTEFGVRRLCVFFTKTLHGSIPELLRTQPWYDGMV